MANLVEIVSELLITLNIEQTVIGGLSVGGYIALNFVRMFPEKVSGLTLADANRYQILKKNANRIFFSEKD